MGVTKSQSAEQQISNNNNYYYYYPIQDLKMNYQYLYCIVNLIEKYCVEGNVLSRKIITLVIAKRKYQGVSVSCCCCCYVMSCFQGVHKNIGHFKMNGS